MVIQQVFLALALATAVLAFQPDNTERNKRDRAGATTKTAQQQGNNKEDLDMVATIRRAIRKDGTLSTNAQNVKIIVDRGHVWLRGPVANEAEMNKVLALAKQSAGEKNVTSQMEVIKGEKINGQEYIGIRDIRQPFGA